MIFIFVFIVIWNVFLHYRSVSYNYQDFIRLSTYFVVKYAIDDHKRLKIEKNNQ